MRNTYFSTKKRLFAMFVAIAFIFFVIFLRLGYIQIVWGKKLQTRALEQWLSLIHISEPTRPY